MTEPSNVRSATKVEAIEGEARPVDNTKAITVLLEANKQLKSVEFVSKEMAEMYVGAAIKAVYSALEAGNIDMAVDVKDKMDVMRAYVHAKYRQSLSDLPTYNRIAAGRQRVTREIGKWLRANFPEPGEDRNIEKDPETGEFLPLIPSQDQRTQDDLGLGVGHNLLSQWRMIAKLSDEDFDEFLSQYEIDTIDEGDKPTELYFSKLLSFCQSKKGKEPGPYQPSFDSALMTVYNDIQKMRTDLHMMVDKISEGNVPPTQIERIRLLLIEFVKNDIQKALDYSGELK